MAIGNPFGNLFGKSPFTPIQQHMAKAHDCAEALVPFLEASIADNWQEASNCQKTISDLENEADELKRTVRINLPKSLFLPVPRSDLLDMLTMQDKIANTAKDVAGLMLGRQIVLPEIIRTEILQFAKESVATSAQALKAINELDELLESGFSGRELKVVEDMIEELDRLETNTDKLQVEIRSALFSVEHELPPVEVMFLYQVIDRIGDLADRAQQVGSRLQVIIAR
jgi:predicted phosphate transport protein (TIGR00153 family)